MTYYDDIPEMSQMVAEMSILNINKSMIQKNNNNNSNSESFVNLEAQNTQNEQRRITTQTGIRRDSMQGTEIIYSSDKKPETTRQNTLEAVKEALEDETHHKRLPVSESAFRYQIDFYRNVKGKLILFFEQTFQVFKDDFEIGSADLIRLKDGTLGIAVYMQIVVRLNTDSL